MASILTMVLGAVPFLKQLIFTADGPLFIFIEDCMILGPGSSKLGFRTTDSIVFARLVLVPPAGLGVVSLADKLGFLPPDDKMFRFVRLLLHTMPTSVHAGDVANVEGCGREGAAVLFWVHVFAVFSMAGWIILYLNMLF